MALPAALLSALEASFDPEVLILTASARTARFLLSAYSDLQLERGRAAWPTPSIHALEPWLHQLWQTHLLTSNTSQLLLSPLQERQLWARTIRNDPASRSLIAPDTLSALAQDAFSLVHSYSARDQLRQYREAASPDASAFLRWTEAFEKSSRDNELLSPARLAATLASLISSGALTLEARTIYLAGFDRLTPAQLSFNRALEHAGIALQPISTDFADSTGSLITAASPLDEITHAAHFCRSTLTANPAARIGILVPGLPAPRPDIDRIFRNILAPESLPIRAPGVAPAHPLPYEFSLGRPLTRVPILHAALQLLRWSTRPLPLDEITALLLSGFVSSPALHVAVARFDAGKLRRATLLQPELSLDSLLARLKPDTALSSLHRSLSAFQKSIAELTRPGAANRTASDWSDHIRTALALSGWPGTGTKESTLDTIQFQAIERWDRLLDEFATLSYSGERIAWADAIRLLFELSAETLFSPESTSAPIQIMEPSESAGLAFDAVWLLNATDSAFPLPGRTHPLLPWPLQRALEMPHADPTADTVFNRQLTHRLAHSAPQFFASYATADSSGPLRLSPLIAALNLTPTAQTIAPIEFPLLTQPFTDDSALPFPPTLTAGGAEVLTLQSACPFRAFAEKRLHSAPVESRTAGLSPSERGNLVHRVLQSFWAEIKTQHSLIQMDSTLRAAALDRAIAAALDRYQSSGPPPDAWESAFLRTEAERLRNLLIEWLDVELTRPAFTVLSSEQERRQQEFAGLRLTTRPDRIDQINSPEFTPPALLLIDYKTGSVNTNLWLGDRPEDPQLPLYAILHNNLQPTPLDGIAFAQVRPGEMCLTGLAYTEGIISIKSPKKEVDDFSTQLAAWEQVLTSLALEFLSGTATVTPREYPVTCKYCTQHILCRVAETNLALHTPHAEEGSDDDPEHESASTHA